VRSPLEPSTSTRSSPCETSWAVGTGADASSSIQIAARTVDFPDDASPTSAQRAPGRSSTSRAARKPWIEIVSISGATTALYPSRRELDPGGLDRRPRLPLERVLAIRIAGPGEQLGERPLLCLPNVAELVREQIVRRRPLPDDDRAPEGIAPVAPQARQPEEPRRDDDAHPVEGDGLRIETQPVEASLRTLESRAFVGKAAHTR
jgi:hypothetical protein